jgi:hypothetical protein
MGMSTDACLFEDAVRRNDLSGTMRLMGSTSQETLDWYLNRFVYSNNRSFVLELLRGGANPNAMDFWNGETAIEKARRLGYPDIERLLRSYIRRGMKEKRR